MFQDPTINLATILFAVLLVFALGGLIAFYATNKEGNKLKYSGNKRLAKYKFSEPPIEDYENEFSK